MGTLAKRREATGKRVEGMKIVIDIPEEVYMDIKEEVRTKVNTFEHIPFLHEVISVGTPLPDGAEILTKDAYSDLCRRAADVPGTNVGELISRQAALGLKTIAPIAPVMNGEDVHYEEVIFVHDLEKLPSVEPERKTGKWINVDGSTNTADCSCCVNRGRAWINYFYECGAKMEVEN